MKTALAVLLFVSTAAEAKSLQLAEFEGKGAGKVRAQVEKKLCRRVLCVEDEKATNVLHGKVVKKHGKPMLEVELRDADGTVLMSQVVPVKGRSTAARVDRAVRDALAGGAPAALAKADEADEDEDAPVAAAEQKAAAAPATAAAPVKSIKTDGAKEEAAQTAAAPAAEGANAKPSKSENAVAATVEREPAVDYSSRILWLGAAVQLQSRQLAYSGLATPELSSGRETAIMPRVTLALFPFAKNGMAGFGVSASFSSTITSSPTELVARELDAMLAYGLRLGGLPLWVRPEVGFRWHVLDGQGASTDYRALRAGLGLEAAFGPLRIYGQAAYLAVIGGAGELTRRYFTRARTGPAFASELGLALNVVGKLDLTVSGAYDVYVHDLAAEPGDLYVARSATDGYLGATAGVRLGF